MGARSRTSPDSIQDPFMRDVPACRQVRHARTSTALLVSTLLLACGGSGTGRSPDARKSGSRGSTPRQGRLHLRRIGHLPVPLQLPSAAALPGGGALVLGGLSEADTSTDGITAVGRSGSARAVGHLPAPLHDSAAAAIGGRVYLFGGGDA